MSFVEFDDILSPPTTPNDTPIQGRKSRTPNTLRRSIGRKSAVPEDLFDFEEENDDQREKEINRKRRETDKRRKSFHTGQDNFISVSEAATIRGRPSAARLDDAELQNLFQNCLKLSTENKITTKNTWKLNLIDYLTQVIGTTMTTGADDDQVSNFQRASCTIDASVKIYASRVDSVHSETFKVLTGLSRADAQTQGEEDVEEDDQQTEEGEGAPKQKTRKVKVGANTLEKDITQLNVKKFEFAHAIEPLYHNNSGGGHHDVGSARSLLLNNLEIGEHCDLILDAARYSCVYEPGQSQTILPRQVEDKPKEDNMEVEDIDTAILGKLDDVLTQDIQPELLNQIEESHQETQKRLSLLNEDTQKRLSLLNENMEVDQEPLEMGGGGFDAADDDDDDDNQDGLFDTDFGGVENDILPPLDENEIETLTENEAMGNRARNSDQGVAAAAGDQDDEEITTNNNSEYSYYDVNKHSGRNEWAGIDHWKASKSASVRAANQTTKKKKSKEVFKLNFKKALEHIDWDNEDFPSESKKKNITANTLSDKTIKTHSAKKDSYLLPDDVGYDLHALLRTYHVQGSRVTNSSTTTTTTSKNKAAAPPLDESGRYFQDVPVLDEPPVPEGNQDDFGGGGFDDDDDDDFGGGDALPDFNSMDAEQPVEIDFNKISDEDSNKIGDVVLIEAPRKVEKLQIQYATTSTKVDVKGLKEHLWKRISGVREGQKMTFSSVVQEMRREQESEFSKVSIAFYFICLLHLANEKNLAMQPQSDLSDFVIGVNTD
ncbi:condensin complex subunit CAP-H [Acrasis kona]|uniref:Condensin complex subunit 2 n=1 Tax=Acrasis kona TaxID=1008807 RepID=A0AAW2YWL6_9EUKA